MKMESALMAYLRSYSTCNRMYGLQLSIKQLVLFPAHYISTACNSQNRCATSKPLQSTWRVSQPHAEPSVA